MRSDVHRPTPSLSSATLLAALVLLGQLLWGCHASHGVEDGSVRDGSVRDGAARDGAGEECPLYAGYRTCGELCDQPCPEGYGCASGYPVCVPQYPIANGCVLNFDESWRLGGEHTYCGWGGFCVFPERRSDVARCYSEEFCRAVTAEHPGRCVHSDGTPYVNGYPPIDTCPGPSDGLPGSLCGGPCGECPMPGVSMGCIGRSETRPVGACVFSGGSTGCSREWLQRTTRCFPSALTPDPMARVECACMVLKVDGEELRMGGKVMLESCQAYRELYPDDVECYTLDTWDRI